MAFAAMEEAGGYSGGNVERLEGIAAGKYDASYFFIFFRCFFS